MQAQRSVFISYRRNNMYIARAVYRALQAQDYEVYLDMERLDSDEFPQAMLGKITARAHFVLLLTPSALEGCVRADDWLRLEIEYAIAQQRNIVPLLFTGVTFEQIGQFLVSEPLRRLPRFPWLAAADDKLTEAIERLRGNRYLDKPLDIPLTPMVVEKQARTIPAPTPAQVESEQQYERGFLRARLKGDYDGAITAFDRAIALELKHAGVFHQRAGAYWCKGDTAHALEDWTKAIWLKPDGLWENIARSAIALIEGKQDEALARADVAVKNTPDYDAAYFQRAYVQAESGNFDSAIADYSEVIRRNPQLAVAYNNRGAARYAKKDLDGAIADYDEAIRLNPQDAMTYNNRGTARYAKRELDRAIMDYTMAIRLNPQNAVAYNNRGTARYAKKDYEGALADYNESIRLNAQDSTTYINRGNTRAVRRDGNGAIEDFEAALRLDPQSERAKRNLDVMLKLRDGI